MLCEVSQAARPQAGCPLCAQFSTHRRTSASLDAVRSGLMEIAQDSPCRHLRVRYYYYYCYCGNPSSVRVALKSSLPAVLTSPLPLGCCSCFTGGKTEVQGVQ